MLIRLFVLILADLSEVQDCNLDLHLAVMNKSKHGLILEVRAHIGGDTVSRWKRCQLSVCISVDRIHEVFSGLRTADQDDRWTAQMDREVGKDRSGAHELLRCRSQLRRLDEGVCIGIEV